jgi:outer membrane lipoprotein-sorting protein
MAPAPSERQAAAGAEPAVTAPASPLPDEEERAAMEERIEASADRMPAGSRLKMWWFTPPPKIKGEAYEQGRGLYLRFLDNFARIKTARFRVEWFTLSKNGTEERTRTEDVISSGRKWRMTQTSYEPGQEPVERLMVCDGKQTVCWREGQRTEVRSAGYPGYTSLYLFGMERSLIREKNVVFLYGYTHCDIDNGSTGYSRLWSEKGNEARFETSSGMLTEVHIWDGASDTYTYQQVNGFWFPQETVNRWEDRKEIRGVRSVYSQVELNEPVDDELFNMNNPY